MEVFVPLFPLAIYALSVIQNDFIFLIFSSRWGKSFDRNCSENKEDSFTWRIAPLAVPSKLREVLGSEFDIGFSRLCRHFLSVRHKPLGGMFQPSSQRATPNAKEGDLIFFAN